MSLSRNRLAASLSAAILFTATLLPAHADEGLHTINNPGGGQVVYGTLTGQSSLPQAMGYMLRQVRGHYGDRPQIGKFFQTKGGDSAAVFFKLTAKTQGNKPLAGMLIVTMPRSGATPTAAVLTDDPSHFGKTQPVMMKALNQAWGKDAAQYAASRPAAAEPAVPSGNVALHQASGGDRSASMGLPSGWRLTGVAGGCLHAEGPNGELMNIACMFQGIRSPMGGDLFNSYAMVSNRARQGNGRPAASFRPISTQRVGGQAIQVFYEADYHDGKGMRKGNIRIDPVYTRGVPSWAMTITDTNAPESVYATQNAVMTAMYKTYSQDRNVIGREQTAVMNGIAAAGARSRANAQAADARREASTAAFNQHMDDIDRSSKAFQNYTLDRSQVQFNDINARGTIDNVTADALVKADPNRFQIITRPDFIKGVDY